MFTSETNFGPLNLYAKEKIQLNFEGTKRNMIMYFCSASNTRHQPEGILPTFHYCLSTFYV